MLLAAVAVGGLFVVGSRSPKDPYLSGGRIPGFDEAVLKILVAAPDSGVAPSGPCVAFAQTDAQIAKGLMTRKDLAGYPAMVFRFQTDSTENFYNRDVPIALSVSFYDKAGGWIAERQLEPCPDIEGCPLVASPTTYRYVVETEKGRQGALGLGAGSRISVTPGCG